LILIIDNLCGPKKITKNLPAGYFKKSITTNNGYNPGPRDPTKKALQA
jgi:hypothetical protein